MPNKQPPRILTDVESETALDRAIADNVHRNVIAKLAATGLSADLIAVAIDQPISQVRSVIVQLKAEPPTPVLDEALADDVRSLAAICLREARLMVEFGSPETKLAVIKPMLSSLSRHVAQSVGGEGEEARSAFEDLLDRMKKDVDPVEHVVTDTGILDVQLSEGSPDGATASAFDLAVDDQDQRT